MQRSLIDASEKPLRRSPPGKPHEQEDWPVLFPDRPTTPGTLQMMAGQEDSSIATLAQPPQIKERYPLLPSSSYGPPVDVEQKPVQKSSSSPKIQQKHSRSSEGRQDVTMTNNTRANKENVKPNTGAAKNAAEAANNRASTSPSKPIGLAISSATKEKSLQEAKPAIEPRQTRTSSLRARLSAGQISQEHSSETTKGLGSTNPHMAKASSTSQYKEGHTSNSLPPGVKAISKKSSIDSLHGRRPAQFIAGSRRPSSRGSVRSESRASSNSTIIPPPARAAPVLPSAVGEDPFNSTPLVKYNEARAAPRKSSIPISQQKLSTVLLQADGKPSSSEKEAVESHTREATLSAQDFGIFEDSNNTHEPSTLGAIEESPRTGYHLKRLSVTSPQHGPTLKISPSADRLIMGTGSEKENGPVNEKKKGRGIDRVLAQNLRSSTKIRAPLRSIAKPEVHPRPSSSQGLPLSASRPKLLDSDAREKKVKSADIGACLSLDHLVRLSGKETPQSSRKTASASTNDDPFFDAQSSLDKRTSRVTVDESEARVQPDNGSWVGPVLNHLGQTADGDALLLPADVQSVLTHEGSVQVGTSVTPPLVFSEELQNHHVTDGR